MRGDAAWRLDGNGSCLLTRMGVQKVATAAHGVQECRVTGVDLAAQVADVGLDEVDVDGAVVGPQVVSDGGLDSTTPGLCMK